MTTSTSPQSESQYSLVKILIIWAAAAVPMGILAWIIKPAIAPDFESDPLGGGQVKLGLLLLGLIWMFALSMIIVYREAGNLRWTTIKKRFWLNTPRNHKTGKPSHRLWLWLIPGALILFLIWSFAPPTVDRLWVTLFPFFAAPPDGNIGEVLQQPEITAQLAGNWLFLGLFLLMAVFNIIGEEFIFRGILLPKAKGVFRNWDWVAIGVLFGCYHIHQPWMILGGIIIGLLLSYMAKWFRCTWMPIIIHSIQFLVLLPMVFMAFLGLV
ncbi:CPBP family intramembrane glutamic endopeptidase [Chloroflexota bacterium]